MLRLLLGLFRLADEVAKPEESVRLETIRHNILIIKVVHCCGVGGLVWWQLRSHEAIDIPRRSKMFATGSATSHKLQPPQPHYATATAVCRDQVLHRPLPLDLLVLNNRESLHLSFFFPFSPSHTTFTLKALLYIRAMSSLPPVYVVSAVRTPIGSFLGCVSPFSPSSQRLSSRHTD